MSCLTDCWVNYFGHFGVRYMYRIKVLLMIKSQYCMWHVVFMMPVTHEHYWLLYKLLATRTTSICFHERTKPTLYHPAFEPLGLLVIVLHTFPGSIKYNRYLCHANVCYVNQICIYMHGCFILYWVNTTFLYVHVVPQLLLRDWTVRGSGGKQISFPRSSKEVYIRLNSPPPPKVPCFLRYKIYNI